MFMEKTSTFSKSFQWLFISFALLGSFIASAQITITQNDMPEPGWTLVRAIDTTSSLLPGEDGINQTWDFSTAPTDMNDTVVYTHPSEVPNGNLFPAANLAEARRIIDPEGTLNSYFFWNSNSDGYYAVGIFLNITASGFNHNSIENYDPDPGFLSFPLNYGDETTAVTTGTSYSSTRVENFLLDSTMVISHITSDLTADGSGTIITPIDSYEALRIHVISTNVDSTYTWNQGLGWVFERTDTYENESYSWFTEVLGEVATLTIDDINTNFQYLSTYIIGVPDITKEDMFSVYPNPAGNLLYINSPDKYSQVEIFDLKGQLVLSSGSEPAVQIGRLERGVYLCRLTGENGVFSKKFVKE